MLIKLIAPLDYFLERTLTVFVFLGNSALGLMLLGTSVAILARPLGISFYWIWPWTTVLFVWMTFFGLFVVYRLKKDVVVDFAMVRLGPLAMRMSRVAASLAVIAVLGIILYALPDTLSGQLGGVDGAALPWGGVLNRLSLSVPMAISCVLIITEAVLDLIKCLIGLPETKRPDPMTDIESTSE